MKLVRKHDYTVVNSPYTIEQAVMREVCQDDADDQLDRLRDRTSELAHMMGRLVQRLADKGLLYHEDVVAVLGGGWKAEG